LFHLAHSALSPLLLPLLLAFRGYFGLGFLLLFLSQGVHLRLIPIVIRPYHLIYDVTLDMTRQFLPQPKVTLEVASYNCAIFTFARYQQGMNLVLSDNIYTAV
jgi:hypothetical protein